MWIWCFLILRYARLENDMNFNVKVFQTGEECIAHLDEKPDIVVMDYFLPGMNGIETMKVIKKKLPIVPVIFLSAQNEGKTVLAALKAGAEDYVVKGKDAFGYLEESVLNSIRKIRENDEVFVLNFSIKKYETLIPILILVSIGFLISIVSLILG